jgi:hypothetical protein
MRRFSAFFALLITMTLFTPALAADVETCPYIDGRYYLPNVALTIRDGELLLVDIASRASRSLGSLHGDAAYWGKSCRYIIVVGNRQLSGVSAGGIIDIYDAQGGALVYSAGRPSF